MTFLLDSDSAEVEGMPCDQINETAMRSGSAKLLAALNRSRGIVPPVPLVPKSPPMMVGPLCQAGKPKALWPEWYHPPRRTKFGNELLASIAGDFDLTVTQMRSEGRQQRLVDARAVAAMILRERGLSYPQVARLIGRKDHSTVMNLTSKFDIFCCRNPTVVQSYERHRELAA